MKKYLTPILFTLLNFICTLYLMNKCSNKQFSDLVMKELAARELTALAANKQLANEIVVIKEKNDSLQLLRGKILPKVKKSHLDAISIVEHANCDSISKVAITKAIDSLNLNCMQLIANDSMQINNYKSIIVKQAAINTLTTTLIYAVTRVGNSLYYQDTIVAKAIRTTRSKRLNVNSG